LDPEPSSKVGLNSQGFKGGCFGLSLGNMLYHQARFTPFNALGLGHSPNFEIQNNIDTQKC